jgi:hypothetical protein
MVEQTLLTPITHEGKKISLAEMYIQNEGWREVEDESKFTSIQCTERTTKKFFSSARQWALCMLICQRMD